jgi:rod shape-determining protein MreD
VLFALCAAMLQSTILQKLSLYNAVPDLILLIIIWTSYHNGNMSGQVAGFFSGLVLDLLSSAPLGLNAFIYTTVGALAGLLRGTFMLDVLFFPLLLCAGATATKAVLVFVLHFLFTDTVPVYSFTKTFFAELGLNSLLAPLIFSFLNRFKLLLKKETKSNATS